MVDGTRTHDTVGVLRGHRSATLGRSPFADIVPSVLIALLFGVAAVVWAIGGNGLPGGRWLAVHLFTLGVLTNLVLALTRHFARTLTHSVDSPSRWALTILNLGVLAVLIGLPTDRRWAVGAGATVVTAMVLIAYVRLRRMRKSALGARFAWIVRMYERAHSAFIHGAVLGLLMGVGVFRGDWYASARVAHLHVNLLGWAGLTLLATLVFFGPTIARTRIRPGADERAARALRHGATALSLAVYLLLGSGLAGSGGAVMRMAAAAGLAVYAVAVIVVCQPVMAAARAAKPSASRWSVVAVTGWFMLVAVADVVVVASGRWWILDALGLAMLIGVLAQALLTTLTYLAPMLRGRTFAGRDVLLGRFERAARTRATAVNIGVTAVVGAAIIGGPTGHGILLAGWVLIGSALAYLLAGAFLPVRDTADTVVSRTASRYRS